MVHAWAMSAACTTSLTVPLPPGAAGHWCRISVWLPGAGQWWARLDITDEARGQVVRSCFLGAPRMLAGGQQRATLVHVPAAARHAAIAVVGGQAAAARLHIHPLGRLGTALRLLWHGRRHIAGALAGDRNGWLGRLRAVLGQAPARAGQAPPYAVWIELYEVGLAQPAQASADAFQVAVTGPDGPALAATQSALAAQTVPGGGRLRIADAGDWAAVSAPWVVLVRAGEVLAPRALAWFAAAAAAHPQASFMTADCDRLLPDGTRADPLFKPGPDPLLLRSLLPVQGACAVRWTQASPDLPADAQAARQALALLRDGGMIHIPRVLTHIRDDAAASPPRRVAPRRAADFTPAVTALVPSALRAAHAVRCLRRMIDGTDYPRFSADVLVGDMAGARAGLLAQARAVPRVLVRDIALPAFNYAAANNRGAALAGGELLLLLNDDVAPARPDWLSAMVAHMQDARVGIVGARLLYGNGLVQHEGVIMGLAHLCEHAGRLRPAGDSGLHGLGLLDRQVSAVTGACMLIRADLYRALGGMDESFSIALNDVDLCLRARQAGWGVVYCAHAELWHYESLSLGRHYAGARAALESAEVRRLRARWADVIAADPFYSPLASLEPGREWQPGFPPRTPSITTDTANTAATVS
jgi:hypothetical protein